MTIDGATLAWTPQSLALRRSDATLPLATPRAAAGTLHDSGARIAYAASWTLPELSDELIVGPGSVEHNLVFAARPQLPEGVAATEPLTLELSALLTLPPGMALAADGAVQTGAFVTDGGLELRDAAGQPQLAIAPAAIFERDRQSQRTGARYRVEPRDAVSWLVTMETPWSWWAEAGRQYPVVWDPKLAVVGPLTVKQVAQTPGGAGCGFDGITTGVGFKPECGDVRTLVKFNNLGRGLFPREFAIDRASLVVAASGGVFNKYDLVALGMRVERITDGG